MDCAAGAVDRRTVYVLMTEDQEATNARMASVQRAVERHTLKGPPGEVLLTDRDVQGGSGEYYGTGGGSGHEEFVPSPRLPARQQQRGSTVAEVVAVAAAARQGRNLCGLRRFFLVLRLPREPMLSDDAPSRMELEHTARECIA